MSEISTSQLLELSPAKQWEWVQQQVWYNNEDFEQTLFDAPIIAMAVPNLDLNVKDYLNNFKDYGTGWLLKTRDFVSEERADELDENGDFSEEEKKQIRECLIYEALDNCGVHEARVVRKTHDSIELLVIFEGTNHPQHGFEPNFLGVFDTESSAEKALEKIGELIEI